MRLLPDQGLPRTEAYLLRQSGIDTLHVGEIGYAMAEDEAILKRGRDEGRAIVTFDADFHALLARSNAGLPSVIRIRIEGLRADALVKVLQDVLTRCEEDLEQGAVVTVQPAAIRIRRLPLRAHLPSSA